MSGLRILTTLALGALLALPALAAGKDEGKNGGKGEAKKAAKAAARSGKDAHEPCDHEKKPCDHGDKHGDEANGKPNSGGCCAGCREQPRLATALIAPTAGNKVRGIVQFTESDDGSVTVSAELEGLNPGQQHAMHVHELGDCSAADATSAGGHFNPEGHEHGLPDKEKRHAGDFGNVTADAGGRAKFSLVVDNLTVAKWHSVAGRSVIVHAKADDGGQPTGNAGGRVACGVIGIAKAPEAPKAPAPGK